MGERLEPDWRVADAAMAQAFDRLSDEVSAVQFAHGLTSTQTTAVLAELLSDKLAAALAARRLGTFADEHDLDAALDVSERLIKGAVANVQSIGETRRG